MTAAKPQGETRGQVRVVIEAVTPQVDGGKYPVKRVVGETVRVEADAFTDGHDSVACVLLHRRAGEAAWQRSDMLPLGNDRWRGEFLVTEMGRHEFSVLAWVDHLTTWQKDLVKRQQAGQDIRVDLKTGSALIQEVATRAPGDARARLERWARTLADESASIDLRYQASQDPALLALTRLTPDPKLTAQHPALPVQVSRLRARYSSWYEFFPRSVPATESGAAGTLRACIALLPGIAAMGFDVVYLPPIHPIGTAHRKGPNNTVTAGPNDPGSPWAIGSAEGGHKAVHPELGTLADFRALVAAAGENRLSIAMDVAFQCSPDHPYVREHPEWFRKRADGSIQYAENPPKKYQDIYPFDFECADWWGLWQELKSVFEFWMDQGVSIFRVDNPHTKPFAFWEWVIGEITAKRPDVIFLAEAFTRPKIMYRLAKAGFTQSYTYFSWRNRRDEIEQYFRELRRPPVSDFFRPNLWPNTPDILPEFLQYGGRPAFCIRIILATTLGASYGVYGPAFELLEAAPLKTGGEEYRDSEKYQTRSWDVDRADSLRPLITRLNQIRAENSSLQTDDGLIFHPTNNDALIAYSKSAGADEDTILVIVNLDPHHTQSGWVNLDLSALELEADASFQVHDLLSDARFLWHGARNFVVLDPHSLPAHVFRIRHRIRSERDFDYFL
jgi:starch synthase (maltosyl-transferring)